MPLFSIAGQQYCVNTEGLIYSGNESFTRGYVQCQWWDSQHPHAHRFTDPAMFLDANLTDAANYCRAPDGERIWWCYTTSTEQRWDYCDFDRIYWGILCSAIIQFDHYSDALYNVSTSRMNRHMYNVFGFMLWRGHGRMKTIRRH